MGLIPSIKSLSEEVSSKNETRHYTVFRRVIYLLVIILLDRMKENIWIPLLEPITELPTVS